MEGRIEKERMYELKTQDKIKGKPEFLIKFYYSLSAKTHMTKYRYICNILRFLNHLTNNQIDENTINKLQNVDSYYIEKYIMDIKMSSAKNIKESSIAPIYVSLNSFFIFLCKLNYISNNPFDKNTSIIERPKMIDNEIIYLEPEEWKAVKTIILKGIGSDRAKARQKDWAYRDLLLFTIPIITGVRVDALSNINLEDINLKQKYIKVTDKGRKDRTLYIDDKTCGLIEIWLQQRNKLLNGIETQALFISNQKTRLNVRSIEKIVGKYTEILEDKHITPHKLRSTCGTNLYQLTGDIYLVADVLGHNSPETSKKYTKIKTDNRRKATDILANAMS